MQNLKEEQIPEKTGRGNNMNFRDSKKFKTDAKITQEEFIAILATRDRYLMKNLKEESPLYHKEKYCPLCIVAELEPGDGCDDICVIYKLFDIGISVGACNNIGPEIPEGSAFYLTKKALQDDTIIRRMWWDEIIKEIRKRDMVE